MRNVDRKLAVLVAAAGASETAAVVLVLGTLGGLAPLVGAFAHAAAALLCLAAAKRSRGEISKVERDLVLLASVFLPLFGAPVAWTIPPRRARARKGEKGDASMFDRYADHVKPQVPESERTVFSGDYGRDLARELDIESYVEVLRNGRTDQKRNALRRLADLGAPRHLALVRRCLVDPDHEVRLYAYSELERLARVHEDRIMKRRGAASAPDADPKEVLALAEAHFEYGSSGIPDAEMAAYHFRLADRHASAARARGNADPACVWIRSLALGRLEDPDAAEKCLDELDAPSRALPRTRIVYAELAYRRRDFSRVREEACALASANAEIPGWMKALGSRKDEPGTPEPGEETATAPAPGAGSTTSGEAGASPGAAPLELLAQEIAAGPYGDAEGDVPTAEDPLGAAAPAGPAAPPAPPEPPASPEAETGGGAPPAAPAPGDPERDETLTELEGGKE